MKKTFPLNSWDLFRILVVPALFLCAIVKHPATQWVAAICLAAWLVVQVAQLVKRIRPDKPAVQDTDKKTGVHKSVESEVSKELTHQDLFLIRQVNHRITEHLKYSYPAVSWLWARRPSCEELQKGGTWRIRLTNTEPYNFAEVNVKADGQLSITMILAAPLRMPEHRAEEDQTDLKQEELLDRTDARTWYTEYAEDLLASLIDDLNTQGHKKLVIHEDGEVLVQMGEKQTAINKLEWFLPRMAWENICSLLKEDGISAEADDQGLSLAW